MKKNIIYLFTFLFFFSFQNIDAKNYRVGQVPNGNKFSCNTCHTNGGGTPRNDFGRLIQKSFLVEENGQFNVKWGPLIASLDSDNDGVTNGQELHDPFGLFSEGETNPGIADLVTNAGLNSSSPQTTLTVNFSGMTPHNGQTLWLRLFDKINQKEVSRTSISISESFSITIDGVVIGGNYNIDFFADHNGNGEYDAPPMDHAWRMELDKAIGSDVVEFSHNTNFTDIEWPFILGINFFDMTPHVGQLLEVRVEDEISNAEVGRRRIEFISDAQFSLSIPGIQINREYKVEMYADLNNNGIYDEPPSDHAWEIKFENNTGDYSIDFTHNTDFKDIGWKYLYTLNFMGMTPHIGQSLEMRVVRIDNGVETNRTSIEIPGAEFVLHIPQIEMDHDYNVDFYSDHNGNGVYDAPPTDHAWRLNFNSSTGNFVQNFSHNTDFVDIGWTNVTDVNQEKLLSNTFILNQNFPNPFNPSTTISFELTEAKDVTLRIFNILGQEVSVLLEKKMNGGQHQVNFNANSLESGTYYYRLEIDESVKVRKMLLIK